MATQALYDEPNSEEDSMPVLNQHVGINTPLGATLAFGGATFRTWAPAARDVYLVTAATTTDGWSRWTPIDSERLFPLGDDTWAGFVPNMVEGDPYLFWIRGPEGGDAGFKRDSYARELGIDPPFPNCPCIIRDPETYPWRVADWTPPRFRDFIIYQLHIGVFWAVDAAGQDRRRSYGRFLDVIERLPYLRDLGINAVQFLPIQEYSGDFGLGCSWRRWATRAAVSLRRSATSARPLGSRAWNGRSATSVECPARSCSTMPSRWSFATMR